MPSSDQGMERAVRPLNVAPVLAMSLDNARSKPYPPGRKPNDAWHYRRNLLEQRSNGRWIQAGVLGKTESCRGAARFDRDQPWPAARGICKIACPFFGDCGCARRCGRLN